MQWRPTNPIWYSLDINLRGGPYNRWWHTILLGDTEEMRTTWSVYVNHRGTTDAGTLEMCCRSWSEAHLSLSVVVIEAEKSIELFKSDLCIIFSAIIMKSTTQQCKNERTSFYLKDLWDLLVCSWRWQHHVLRWMQWRPTNPIWYSLDTNMRGRPYNSWWHTILLGRRHRGDEDNLDSLSESSWYHRCWNFKEVFKCEGRLT